MNDADRRSVTSWLFRACVDRAGATRRVGPIAWSRVKARSNANYWRDRFTLIGRKIG
jgi:hypothetical protein